MNTRYRHLSSDIYNDRTSHPISTTGVVPTDIYNGQAAIALLKNTRRQREGSMQTHCFLWHLRFCMTSTLTYFACQVRSITMPSDF